MGAFLRLCSSPNTPLMMKIAGCTKLQFCWRNWVKVIIMHFMKLQQFLRMFHSWKTYPTKFFLHLISFCTCLHMTVTNIVQSAELFLELYEVCGFEMMKLFTALVSQREGCQKGCLGVCV